ncbi:MAG: AAA family ATPase [Ignavibacteriae bacterium]|nr:AAA family ATPase [Ignavibacteriota bacterium]
MLLKKISFNNYKPFGSKQELELKPINLIIGKNSSGKSVLTRLPILLNRAFSRQANSPIEFEFDDFSFGGSFKDLIYNKDLSKEIEIGIVIEDDSNTIEYNVHIRDFAEQQGQQLITYFSLIENDQTVIKGEISLDSSKNISNYSCSFNNTSTVCEIKFQGLFPETFAQEKPFLIEEKVAQLKKKIRVGISNYNFFAPFRREPKRYYSIKSGRPKSIGMRGENAADILGLGFGSLSRTTLVKDIGKWYFENFGWELDIEKVSDSLFSIVLFKPNSDVKINIMDVGQGMGQVLPIILREFDELDKGNGYDIIEQPELHLHPAALGSLAQLFVNSWIKQKTRYIIETHSEVIVLRIRRLVAGKHLKPSDVNIVFVDETDEGGSILKKIQLDEEGNVNFWPEGIFSEDFDEALAIENAINNRL